MRLEQGSVLPHALPVDQGVGSLDWGSGVPVGQHAGPAQRLTGAPHLPEKLLYDYGYQKPEVNDCELLFSDPGGQLSISDKRPGCTCVKWKQVSGGAGFAVGSARPGPGSWRTTRGFSGAAAVTASWENSSGVPPRPVAVDYATGFRRVRLSRRRWTTVQALLEWVRAHGLPKPALDFEVCHAFGEVLTVVDLAWLAGVQENFSQPVALIMPGDQGQINVLNQAGYRFFTRVEDLRAYLEKVLDLRVEEEAV